MPIYGVFSGPYFPVFGLNTEIYGVNLCIQSEYRKIRTRKNSVFGHFSRSVQTAATIQQNDIPRKILKENSAVVAIYFHENINFCTENLILPSDLKVADVTPAVKKKCKTSKDNYIPLTFYLIYLKYMKDVFATKFRLTFMKSYLNINVDFTKDLMHNTI